MHIEPARGLRHVAARQFIKVLDVIPARAIRRYRVFRRLCLAAFRREQRGYDVVRVGGLGEIIDCAAVMI